MVAESGATQSRSISGLSEGSSIFDFEYRTVRRRIFTAGSKFTPRLGGYGGRIEKDRVFGGDSWPKQQNDKFISEERPVERDEDADGISWVDLAEEDLEVETVGDILLAFN